ncbi:hypothetical protein RS030_223500 [Cryptosporidium xiaoi]|uniref:Uncharacterized protein n=1 Tax=Cryptosporidium xiaoi TaxID=659607 RepID=A0AAV9XWS4_9CRYT
MGEIDVSIILNYLESNFGVNTASSTGIDLNTFTSMVKKLKLGWSNGQIRHAMIFLSGGRNPTSMYHSINSLKKSDSKRKNKYQLSVKVNDFINKIVTIENGIPSSISSTQLRSGTLVPLNEKSSILSSFSRNSNSDKKGSIISNSNCIKEEQHKNTDKIQIEEYVYSHSELEEEIIERV